MTGRFKLGDHVTWNSEAGAGQWHRLGIAHHGILTTKVIRIGPVRTIRSTEIKSDKTDHIAAHKGSASRRVGIRNPDQGLMLGITQPGVSGRLPASVGYARRPSAARRRGLFPCRELDRNGRRFPVARPSGPEGLNVLQG